MKCYTLFDSQNFKVVWSYQKIARQAPATVGDLIKHFAVQLTRFINALSSSAKLLYMYLSGKIFYKL